MTVPPARTPLIVAGTEIVFGQHLPTRITPIAETAKTKADVVYVIMTRFDGTTFRLTPVQVGAVRFVAFDTYINGKNKYNKHTVVRWTAYNTAGRKLGTGPIRHYDS